MKIRVEDLLHIAFQAAKKATPMGTVIDLAEGVAQSTGVIKAQGEDAQVIGSAIELVGNPFHDANGEQQAAPPTFFTNASKSGGFVLGPKSTRKLGQVNSDLQAIVRRAINLTAQDFTVFEGLRTIERQRQLVATGMSKTLKSKHLDGNAVDLVPWINGVATWDWDGCRKIAIAMGTAARELNLDHRLVWGAVWDYPMSNYAYDPQHIRAAMEEYKTRHAGPDFVDGPHYQLGF